MRAFDRLLSVVLALALLVLGVVVAAEVLSTLFGRSGHLALDWQALAAWGRAHSWTDLVVRIIGAGLAVLGLALLLTEIRRRRPALLVLRPRTEGVTSAVSRSSLARAMAARADDVVGVRGASVRLGRRGAVTAKTVLRDPGDLKDRVDTTMTEWVARLDLVAPPAVRVRLKRKASS